MNLLGECKVLLKWRELKKNIPLQKKRKETKKGARMDVCFPDDQDRKWKRKKKLKRKRKWY